MSEHKHKAWISIDLVSPDQVAECIGTLGYSCRVDLVRFLTAEQSEAAREGLRWRRRPIALDTVYDEADQLLGKRAPHRRSFRLVCGDGITREITGYRGGRGPTERRALPPLDARLLVNLIGPPHKGLLLDPFAGGGAIPVEAGLAGWRVITMDLDASLRYGLHDLSGRHCVANASLLPISESSIEGIATEPPFDQIARDPVRQSVAEMHHVLTPGGSCSLMVASHQSSMIEKCAAEAGFESLNSYPVNRKGTEVAVHVWKKGRGPEGPAPT